MYFLGTGVKTYFKNKADFLLKGICLISISIWFYSAHLYSEYGQSSAEPNPLNGKIIPFDWKGKTVFVTESERRLFWLCEVGPLLLFGIASLIYGYLKQAEIKTNVTKFGNQESDDETVKGYLIAGVCLVFLASSLFIYRWLKN